MTNIVIISTIASLVLIFVFVNTFYYVATFGKPKSTMLPIKHETIAEFTLLNSILIMAALFSWPFIAKLFSLVLSVGEFQ